MLSLTKIGFWDWKNQYPEWSVVESGPDEVFASCDRFLQIYEGQGGKDEVKNPEQA